MGPAPNKSEHKFYEHICPHEIFTPLFCSWGQPRTTLNTNYTKYLSTRNLHTAVCSWSQPRTTLNTNSTNRSVHTKSLHRCLLVEPAPNNPEHKLYESICPHEIFTPLFCSWGRPRRSLNTNSTNRCVHTKSLHRCVLVGPAPNNSEHKFYESICPHEMFIPLFCSWGWPRTSLNTNYANISVHTKSLHRCLLVEPAPNNSEHKFYESTCPHEIFTPLFCSWGRPRTSLNTNSTNISVHTKSLHRCLLVEPAPDNSEHKFYESICPHEICTPLFCSWGRPRTTLNTNSTNRSVHTKSLHRCFARGARPEQL